MEHSEQEKLVLEALGMNQTEEFKASQSQSLETIEPLQLTADTLLHPPKLDEPSVKVEEATSTFSMVMLALIVLAILLSLFGCASHLLKLFRKENASAMKRKVKAKKTDKDIEV